jgi:hypothetical protein
MKVNVNQYMHACMYTFTEYLYLFLAYFPKIKEAFQIISLCVCPITFELAGRFL